MKRIRRLGLSLLAPAIAILFSIGVAAIALWAVYGLCQMSVPIFLWKIGVRKRKQLFISFLSFYFWAVAYGPLIHSPRKH